MVRGVVSCAGPRILGGFLYISVSPHTGSSNKTSQARGAAVT